MCTYQSETECSKYPYVFAAPDVPRVRPSGVHIGGALPAEVLTDAGKVRQDVGRVASAVILYIGRDYLKVLSPRDSGVRWKVLQCRLRQACVLGWMAGLNIVFLLLCMFTCCAAQSTSPLQNDMLSVGLSW